MNGRISFCFKLLVYLYLRNVIYHMYDIYKYMCIFVYICMYHMYIHIEKSIRMLNY
jgi:hypothetical protein